MTCAGRTAIVTGAAGKGMGRSIALTLAREGANVVVNYRTSSKSAAAIVAHIEKGGGRALAFQADITQQDQCKALVHASVEAFGQVESINILKDRFSGKSKGFGFVKMPSEEEGKAAIKENNGKDLKGATLRVDEAHPRPVGSGRRGGGPRRGGGSRRSSGPRRGGSGGERGGGRGGRRNDSNRGGRRSY